MKLRNTALAIGLALVGIGLATPVLASAEELWWFDHREGRFPTSAIPKDAEPNLENLIIKDKNGHEYGPCKDLKVNGQLYNKLGGMGEGSITGVALNEITECPATPAECKVIELEPLTKTPWGLTLQSTKKVSITNFSITIELAGKCTGSAIAGNEATISGNVEEAKATFVPFNGTNSAEIAFGEAKIGGSETYLKGSIRFGTELTALKEPEGFTLATSPALLDGTQLSTFVFTRTGRTVECQQATFTGTTKTEVTTLTVAPTFKSCKTAAGPATVKMNGCEYRLHLEAVFVEGETYTYLAPTDLICPAGKAVELDVYTSEANHASGTVLCRYTFSPGSNEGLESVELTNKAPILKEEKIPRAWIEAHIEIGKVTSKRTAGAPLLCGAEVDATGTMKGTYQVTATTEEGLWNGIAVFPG